MTREAKIGMLTGLGVIILIGVLLSSYLGDPNATMPGSGSSPGAAGGNATGRMANLPVGAAYRQQVTAPVSVPAMGMDGTQAPGLAGGSEIISPINTSNGMMPPNAYAVDNGAGNGNDPGAVNGPAVRGPVSPLAVGPIPVDRMMEGAPPMIMVPDNSHAVPLPDSGVPGAARATMNVTCTIGSGDTLNKLAKKYYNSAKPSDLQRIVAANPGVLKDISSVLVQGKKLVIPNVPVAHDVAAVKVDSGAIPLPGGTPLTGGVHADPAPKAQAAKKQATTVYTVQSGDTLQKIARKFAPGKSGEMLQKLASVNGIKDRDSLQAGMKLKVPVLAEGH